MATQRSTSKAQDGDTPSGTTTPDGAEQKAPVTDESVNLVAPLDGPEHGYVGQAHPDKNRDDYTVAGVTGGTGNTKDKPKSGEDIRRAWKPLQS
jgi:hypothetical protein